MKRFVLGVILAAFGGSLLLPTAGIASKSPDARGSLGAVSSTEPAAPVATTETGLIYWVQNFVWGSLPFLSVPGTEGVTSEQLDRMLDAATQSAQ